MILAVQTTLHFIGFILWKIICNPIKFIKAIIQTIYEKTEK